MKRFAISLSMITLVAGCAASPVVDSEPSEEVGTAEQALGEAACSTNDVTSDPAHGALVSNPSFFCSFWDTAVSPDTAYGDNPNACTLQFVTEVDKVSGRAFGFVARAYPANT